MGEHVLDSLEVQMTRRLMQIGQRAMVVAIAPALLAILGSGCGSSDAGTSSSTNASSTSASTLAPVHGSYSPSIDPANFVATIDNRYFPLEPGTTYHYKGVRGTTPQTDDALVTNQTKQVLG